MNLTHACILTLTVLWTIPALADNSPPEIQSSSSASSVDESVPPDRHFAIDPVFDATLIAGGLAVVGFTELILSSGEILAVLPGPKSNLLGIDSLAVKQHVDSNANLHSTIALAAAAGFALLDPFLSASRDGWNAALADAVLYVESIVFAAALTDFTKISVRRPRPVAYVRCAGGTSEMLPPGCTETDLALSFFSGHASIVAAIGSTATYLAFERAGASEPRPWITLGVSVAMCTFVSYERVRSGKHFPTDVIAGTLAGAMIGVMLPHLHRYQRRELEPRFIFGYTPLAGGGALSASGSL